MLVSSNAIDMSLYLKTRVTALPSMDTEFRRTVSMYADSNNKLIQDINTKPTKRERKAAKRELYKLEQELGRTLISFITTPVQYEVKLIPDLSAERTWDNSVLVENATAVYNYLVTNLIKTGCTIKKNEICFGQNSLTIRVGDSLLCDSGIAGCCKTVMHMHTMQTEQVKQLAHCFYEWCMTKHTTDVVEW